MNDRRNYVTSRIVEIRQELAKLAPAMAKEKNDGRRADAVGEALITYAAELTAELADLQEEIGVIEEAINFAIQYGQTSEAHHKSWVIDQIVRILAGDSYPEVVKFATAGEDGPNTYSWDTGIAP